MPRVMPKINPELAHKDWASFSIGVVMALLVGAGLVVAGMNILMPEVAEVHDAELQYASASPQGDGAGLVIPASCEAGSYYEHSPGACSALLPPPSINYTCINSGWAVNVGWGASAGATTYMPRIAGIDATMCSWLSYWWWGYGSCNHDDYNALSAILPLSPGANHNIWVHARSPYAISDATATGLFSCPLLPVPNPATATCAPDGKSVTITWGDPAGYNAFYTRVATGGVNLTTHPGWSDTFVGTSLSYAVNPNQSYDWWIHSRNPNHAPPNWGNAAGGTFSCPIPPPTNTSAVCDYNPARDLFEIRFAWTAPATYNTFYTRIARDDGSLTADDYLTSSPGWSNTLVGTENRFDMPNSQAAGNDFRYWINTRWTNPANPADSRWSQGAPAPTGAMACELPVPLRPTVATGMCSPGTLTSTTNTGSLQAQSQFASRYNYEYTLVGGPTTRLDDRGPSQALNSLVWGRYTWRVQGENDYKGVNQQGPWLSGNDFECYPPDPLITISATPGLVTKGATTGLVWRVQANYDLDCTVNGAGTNFSFEHRYNPAIPASMTSERTASNPLTTTPLLSTTDFVISCEPQVPTFPNLPVAEEVVRVEVVPSLEER